MLRVMGGKRRFLILETPTLILTVPVGQIYRATAENIFADHGLPATNKLGGMWMTVVKCQRIDRTTDLTNSTRPMRVRPRYPHCRMAF